ncbi:unnamed protein product [Schistosoma mattheei]|uniref:Ovule protein n=2 Tax=Schistosoma TaxID=6181 RepID=A0A183JK67_9TREM|nr:unnamed protein product [Schistosoma curassoni]VDO87333.1 unnamed protein product [Schistosoma mattheei]
MFLSSQDTVLTVQYFCKFGIVKTYNMSIIDCEQLEAVYSLEESANHLVISARYVACLFMSLVYWEKLSTIFASLLKS